MAHIPAAERRRQIVEVAARVIGREGVAKATTRRIGAEAKANIGTIHYTFGSKEDLIEATFAYCWDIASEIIDEAVKAGEGTNGTARELVTRYVDLAIADPDIIAAQYQLLNWALADENRKHQAVNLMRQLDEVVQKALQQADGADEMTPTHERLGRLVVSMLDGILLRFVVTRSEEDIRVDLETTIELMESAFARAASA
ncbi:TetR/AcrR family transcriptional regulator [Amycolatopsis sp. WGS_07]|uniref:TetR/AcrR family transcriptional regulator n=1 Tax=Amycolatopsis sp. WGS_07 TaxID=3076764 RepID=UPI0038730278